MDDKKITEGMPEEAVEAAAPEEATAQPEAATPEASETEQPESAAQPEEAAPESAVPEAAPESAVEAAAPESAGDTAPVPPEMPVQPEAPAYNMYGDTVYKKPKKKVSRGIIIGISAGAVFLVASIVLLVLLLRKTPEEKVKQAFDNTFSVYTEDGYSVFEDSLGLSEIDTDDLDVNATCTFNTSPALEGMEGATFDFSSSVENTNDIIKEDMSCSLQIAGESLGVDLYYLDDMIYFGMPEIYGDAVFKLDMDEMLDEAYADAEDAASADSKRAEELYEEKIGDLDEQLKESVTYEKVGKTTITDYMGNDVKCKEYKVSVPAEKVSAYVDAFCEYLIAYSDECVTDDTLSSMDMSREDFKSTISSLGESFDYMFPNDFSYTAYISGKKIVRLQADYKIALMGVKLDGYIDFMGTDNIYAKLEMGDANIEYIYSQSGSADMAQTSKDIKVVVDDEVMAEMVSEMEFAADTGAYTYTGDVLYNNESMMQLTCSGAINNIVKGKSFDINLDKISLVSQDEVLFEMAADISYGNKDEAVKEPDMSKVYDMESLDDETLLDEDRLNAIIDAWSEVLNLDDLDEYDDDYYYEEDYYDDDDAYDDNEYEDGGDYQETDYSDVVIKNDDYTITINEPDGFVRAYADDTYISIYDEAYDVSYTLYEDLTDLEALCQEIEDSYSSVYEVTSGELKDETFAGDSIKTYTMTLAISSSTIEETLFFYQIDDDDYLLTTVDIWDYTGETSETAELAEMFLNESVINVTDN